MRKTMSRRRVGQSDIELRLSCLAEQNFLNMPVFEGKAEQNRLYAAAQRERARRKKLLNLRFKRALVAVCMMLLLIGTGAGAYGSIIGYNGVIYEDTDEFTARGFVPDCFRLPYDMLDKFASEKSFAFTLNNEWKIRDIIFKYINENDYLIFNIWNSDSEKFDEDQLVYTINGYAIYKQLDDKNHSYLIVYKNNNLLLESNSLKLCLQLINCIVFYVRDDNPKLLLRHRGAFFVKPENLVQQLFPTVEKKGQRKKQDSKHLKRARGKAGELLGALFGKAFGGYFAENKHQNRHDDCGKRYAQVAEIKGKNQSGEGRRGDINYVVANQQRG